MALSKKGYFFFNVIFLSVLALCSYFSTGIIKYNLLLFFVFTTASVAVFLWKRAWRKIVLVSSIIILGSLMGGELSPVKIFESAFNQFEINSVLVFMVLIFLSLLFGRLYCGYFCPFGAIQEILFIKKFALRIPLKVRKALTYIKYFLLVFILINLLLNNNIISLNETSSELGGNGLSAQYILIGIFIFLIITIYRPFCRFLCPLGALLGLISLISNYKLIPPGCNHCGYCSAHCNVNAIKKGYINKKECLLCGECVNHCKLLMKDNKK